MTIPGFALGQLAEGIRRAEEDDRRREAERVAHADAIRAAGGYGTIIPDAVDLLACLYCGCAVTYGLGLEHRERCQP